MTFYAYAIECFVDDTWAVYTVVISPPGRAVRDYLDAVSVEKRDQVRVRRIKTLNEWNQMMELNPERRLHNYFGDTPCNTVSFDDGFVVLEVEPR